MNENLRDKEQIIEELKNENEYFAGEIRQLKSIIKDLKQEKILFYEEKNKVIKQQREEIESLKLSLNTIEKEKLKNMKDLENIKSISENTENNFGDSKNKIKDLE
jgi:hypothetical protein